MENKPLLVITTGTPTVKRDMTKETINARMLTECITVIELRRTHELIKLLSDKQFDPSYCCNYLLKIAVSKQNQSAVDILIQDPRVVKAANQV